MRHNCLNKKYILDTKRFSIAFSCISKKIETRHFSYLIARNEKFTPSIGIIVGKKKVAKAVRRNLCRRLNKEMFRQHKNVFIDKMLIVVANRNAAQATKEELWQSIKEFFKKYV